MVENVNYEHNIRMLQEIVDELNERYDPDNDYCDKHNDGEKMFEANYSTNGTKGEKWNITFMGIPVFTGGDLDEMNEVLDENYVRLVEENRWKISMLSKVGTENEISDMIALFANSGASLKNKMEWLEILKRGIEKDESLK